MDACTLKGDTGGEEFPGRADFSAQSGNKRVSGLEDRRVTG